MTKTVKTNLGLIEYRDVGQGQPILLLHGGHGNCSMNFFLRCIDTKNHRLIVPSRPGYGNTSLANFKTPVAASLLISSLLDYLDVSKVIAVGISAGGLTAIAFASIQRQRILKLALISAVTKKWLNKEDLKYKIGKVVFHPVTEWLTWSLVYYATKLWPMMMAKQFFKEFSKQKHLTITKEEALELKEMLLKQRSKNGFLNDIKQTNDQEAIAKITCPTLILHSVNDSAVDAEMAFHANNNITNSKLAFFTNKWGHLLWLGKDTEPYTTTLNQFLKMKC